MTEIIIKIADRQFLATIRQCAQGFVALDIADNHGTIYTRNAKMQAYLKSLAHQPAEPPKEQQQEAHKQPSIWDGW